MNNHLTLFHEGTALSINLPRHLLPANNIMLMKKDHFPVTHFSQNLMIPFVRIKWFEAKRQYTTVHTTDDMQYIKCWNIGRVHRFVKQSGLFFLTHESVLAGTLYINWTEKPVNGTITLTDKTTLRLAKRRKKSYKKLRAKMTAGKLLLAIP